MWNLRYRVEEHRLTSVNLLSRATTVCPLSVPFILAIALHGARIKPRASGMLGQGSTTKLDIPSLLQMMYPWFTSPHVLLVYLLFCKI